MSCSCPKGARRRWEGLGSPAGRCCPTRGPLSVPLSVLPEDSSAHHRRAGVVDRAGGIELDRWIATASRRRPADRLREFRRHTRERQLLDQLEQGGTAAPSQLVVSERLMGPGEDDVDRLVRGDEELSDVRGTGGDGGLEGSAGSHRRKIGRTAGSGLWQPRWQSAPPRLTKVVCGVALAIATAPACGRARAAASLKSKRRGAGLAAEARGWIVGWRWRRLRRSGAGAGAGAEPEPRAEPEPKPEPEAGGGDVAGPRPNNEMDPRRR